MKLNDYQQQALTTAIYRKQIMERFNLEPDFNAKERDLVTDLCKDYVLSGFCGEVGEFFGANFHNAMGELGGVFWYTAAVAHEWGLTLAEMFGLEPDATFDDIAPVADFDMDIAVNALVLMNQWKKVLRDNKQYDFPGAVSRIIAGFKHYTSYCTSDYPNIDFTDAARYNLEQLAKRAQEGKIQGDGNNR